MSATGITASKTNRSYTGQAPDRAASLQQRRRVLADPVLLGFRRIKDTAEAEAKKTRHGLPTDGALTALVWVMERGTKPDPALKVAEPEQFEVELLVYATSLEGICEMLGQDVREERKRMLLAIKQAHADAAAAGIRAYVKQRMGLVLTCAGRRALTGDQYVLGLVHPEDWEDVAGVERVDPPAKASRTRHKRGRTAR